MKQHGWNKKKKKEQQQEKKNRWIVIVIVDIMDMEDDDKLVGKYDEEEAQCDRREEKITSAVDVER